MKHTKGEWFACCTDNIPHFIFSDDRAICAICHNDPATNTHERLEGTVTIEESRANAKLIAAAPDLLLVCQMALDSAIDGSYISGSRWWGLMKQAVKKATK